MHLGKRIRRMRQARGLTAVELARRSRVTTGFISQLEHSQTVPSLQTLQRIATALDVSLTYFFLAENPQPQVVRQRERHIFHLGHAGARVALLSPLPPQHLELALLELPPGTVSWSTARAYAGQQCHLVLQGTVRADYGEHTYGLDEGDSILWEGTLPYRLENIGHHEARLLIATAPPSLWQYTREEASTGATTPLPADNLTTERRCGAESAGVGTTAERDSLA
jgi:transcriptional regulator with XRE-family HTH domain